MKWSYCWQNTLFSTPVRVYFPSWDCDVFCPGYKVVSESDIKTEKRDLVGVPTFSETVWLENRDRPEKLPNYHPLDPPPCEEYIFQVLIKYTIFGSSWSIFLKFTWNYTAVIHQLFWTKSWFCHCAFLRRLNENATIGPEDGAGRLLLVPLMEILGFGIKTKC